MFFNVSKPVSVRGKEVIRWTPSGPDPGGSRASPGVSVFRAGYRKLKMGIRTLEKLAVLQKQRGLFQGTACGYSVTSARML